MFAAQSSSATTTTPENVPASFWPYDSDSFVAITRDTSRT
jgi:hypothetical protein